MARIKYPYTVIGYLSLHRLPRFGKSSLGQLPFASLHAKTSQQTQQLMMVHALSLSRLSVSGDTVFVGNVNTSMCPCIAACMHTCMLTYVAYPHHLPACTPTRFCPAALLGFWWFEGGRILRRKPALQHRM